MIKLLHAADLHLDAPVTGQGEDLRRRLRELPDRLAELCQKEQCQLVLLSGDIFDGTPSAQSVQALHRALEQMAVPVFIAPGNHDPYTPDSVWMGHLWPDNVHIFTKPQITSVSLPELHCRIYGAGFDSMDCPPLLEQFHAQCEEAYAIGVLHGDPTRSDSPYCPITARQVQESGLSYLALGHIHQGGSFQAGETLCAWPGCAMGKGWDETGEKGALVVTLDGTASARFVPLGNPIFYELQIDAAGDPVSAMKGVLPATQSGDYYRITLTGETEKVDVLSHFPHIPNLTFIDRTQPPLDIWDLAGGDTLEGIFFQMLREQAAQEPEIGTLAASISRRLLAGQEVTLP